MSPLRKSILVACSPQRAFEVFTQRVDAWWPRSHRRLEDSTMRLEARVGGRFVETGPDGRELLLGQVLDCEPPRRLSCTWKLGAPAELHTLVHLRFLPDGPGTRVELLHEPGEPPLPGWATTVTVFHKAWDHVLQAFTDQTLESP